MRHAGHGDLVGLTAVAAGERQLEQLRRDDRVLPEHLVEIAQAKENDGVGVRALGRRVLLHHRRQCGSHVAPQ
jgi:hypothetical protein